MVIYSSELKPPEGSSMAEASREAHRKVDRAEVGEIMPDYFDSVHRHTRETGPRWLMVAMIEKAIQDIQIGVRINDKKFAPIRQEAWEWIFSDDWSWYFSFRNCCANNDINPAVIRKAVHHLKANGGQVRIRRDADVRDSHRPQIYKSKDNARRWRERSSKERARARNKKRGQRARKSLTTAGSNP